MILEVYILLEINETNTASDCGQAQLELHLVSNFEMVTLVLTKISMISSNAVKHDCVPL